MMDDSQFWRIIDASRERARKVQRKPAQDFMDIHEETLAEELGALSPQDIAAFNDRFWSHHAAAYRWDLWGAAYWLHGGCGNDGFIDFRACLISLGRERFFQVLKDPDSLADIVGSPDIPYMQSEGFQYIASRVYEESTGQSIPLSGEYASDEPAGEKFDFEDEEVMAERFPRILAKFPEMGD